MDGANDSSRLSSRRSPVHEGCTFPSAGASHVEESSTSSSSQEESIRSEGFDLDLFVKYDEKYHCPICMMVMRDPVQTKCGHRFCRICLKHWISVKRHPHCPVCQMALTMSDVFPDNFAKREIMSLLVRCLHYKSGCKQEMELRHLEDHEKECPYAPVECPNGCLERIPRHRLDEHRERFCPLRYEICSYCHTQVRVCNAQKHKEECEEIKIECEYCNKKFKRKEMERHIQSECQQVVIECIFQRYGCQEKFARMNEQDHLKHKVVYHLSLLCYHLQITSPVEQVRLYDVTQSAPVISTLASMTVPPTLRLSTDPGFCSDYSGTSTVYSTAPNRYPVTHSMDMLSSGSMPQSIQSAGVCVPSPVQRHSLRQHSWGYTYPLLKPGLWALDESQLNVVHTLRNTVTEQRQQIEQLSLKVQQQHDTIRQLEADLRDIDGRFCNGTYIWKIHNYRQKRRDAVEQKAVVHHSPGFYTSQYGYKMCIRANLNGVESGMGTHLSLFVHLMQGDYDDVLPWPFQGCIHLSVLDQSGGRHDISETLFAKPGLAAFNKPTSKRNNKGFGYIEFAPLTWFDNDTYVKNNMMLVKIVVKPD